MRSNQALVFIKPHAFGNPAVQDYVAQTFKKHDINVARRLVITGADVASKNLIDQHYSVNARVGTTANPAEIFLGDEGREKFRILFNETWDDALQAGRIISGLTLQKRLATNGEGLNAVWSGYKAQKLAGGVYVAWIAEQNIYVLNGFYTSIRELFTAPQARMELMIADFDADKLPWRKFRNEVIGGTNPATAEPGSIRAYFYQQREALKMTVSYRENVIHASASPFEALIEKTIWMADWPLERDPLWQKLNKAGIKLAQLQQWRDTNPVITADGKPVPLVESLEDMDSDNTADRLIALARQ